MEIIISLFLGCIIGYFVKLKDNHKRFNGKVQQAGVVFLLFSMGASIGANENIIRDLPLIGAKAFTFAALSIIGSIVIIYFLSSKFLENNIIKEKNKELVFKNEDLIHIEGQEEI